MCSKKTWKTNRAGRGARWKWDGTVKKPSGDRDLRLPRMDDADHGGHPDLNPGGALVRAQRLDTVVIRKWKVKGQWWPAGLENPR